MATVLITGAAGLVGHAVRRRLEFDGVAVVALDRQARSEDGVEQTACDLLDADGLDEVFALHRPTAVVHAGGVSGPMLLRDDPTTVVRVNLEGTSRLLEAAHRHGTTRVVYCSSIAVYGSTPPGPVPEDVPLHPTDTYGATKAGAEHLVEACRHEHGISTASLRPVSVFGPRRRTRCLIRDLLLDAAAGRPSRVELPADAPQQYIYVDDAAEAVVRAVRRPEAVGAYNIPGHRTRTVAEVIAAVSAVEPRSAVDAAPADPSAAARWPGPLDGAAAARDLGFVPRDDFTETLRYYRDWLAERRTP